MFSFPTSTTRLVLFTSGAFLALGATACQKPPVAPAAAGLVGEWHWGASQGGFTGKQIRPPASTGAAQKWVFRAASTYQVYTTRQGATQLTQAGTFALGTAPSTYTGQPGRALYLRGPNPQAHIVEELSSNRLALADNYPDGFGHTCVR